ncbi:hypothetical protein AGMMS49944_24020 [Spirochaetia bacterium]|nr:hypothetical protein AGMMS49944_24020 [Spirochaetia bacterium]
MNELNRKAMVLGNKLAPRMGGDRKAAFVQAWIIVKAQGLEVKAAGVSFGRSPVALDRLARYAPSQVRAFIVPEPENPVDPKALRVMVGVQGGRGLFPIGYIPRQAVPVVSVLRGLPAVRVVGDDVKGLRLRFAV